MSESSGSSSRGEKRASEVKTDHHFIPRSYLRGFCDPAGKVWEFNRKFDKCRDRSPASAGKQKYLYSTTDLAGNLLDAVEDSFTDHEQELPRLRTLLEQGETLNQEARFLLNHFAAAMFVRVSTTVEAMGNLAKISALSYAAERLSNPADVRKTLAEVLGDSAKIESLSASGLQRLTDLAIREARSNNITMRVMQIKRMASVELLSQKKLTVYHAPPGKFFITSDRPFIPKRNDLTTPGLKGVMGKGVISCIPFSKETMLVFHDEPGLTAETAVISREEWRICNSEVARLSWRWVYGSSLQQIRSIAEKHRLADVEPQPTFLTNNTPQRLSR